MNPKGFLLLLLLGLLSFTACQQAATPPIQLSHLPSDTQSPSSQPTATRTPAPTETADMVVLSTLTPQQWDEIEVINDLKAKIQSKTPINGWLWQSVHRQHLGFRAYIPSLPDGSPLPDEYFKETWYHINDQKQVDQYIEFTKLVDGMVLATVIYTNGTMYSPYLDQPKERPPFSMGDFDGEMLERMLTFAGDNTYRVTQQELDGRSLMCLAAFEQYGAEMPGYTKIVQAITAENCYDQETGWLVTEEGRYIFADGTEEVTVQATWKTNAVGTPSPVILQQIETAGQ